MQAPSLSLPSLNSLQLASPEVKFEIDTSTHDPTDVSIYQVGACMEGRRASVASFLWE